MDQEKLDHPDDEFTTVDASMISSTSPYQPTTEPVPHRRSVAGGLVMEMRFVKSLPGILKVIEIILSIIVAICVGSIGVCGSSCGPINFMQCVCISAILVTCILYIVNAFGLLNKISFIDWPLTDLLNAVIFFLLYLIASSILAANLSSDASKAAIAFGYFSTITFSASSWLSYQAYMLERQKRHPSVSHIKGITENPEMQEFA